MYQPLPGLKPHQGILPLWTNPAGIPRPVGAWIMNERGGNKVFDVSGNSNNIVFAAANSPIWERGAVYFNQDDWMTCPHSDSLDLLSTFTIAAWFIPTGIFGGNTRNAIAQKGEQAYEAYTLGIQNLASGGEFFARILQSDDTTVETDITKAIAIADKINFAVALADGAFVRIYLDGKLEDSVAYDGTIKTTADDFVIGSLGIASGDIVGWVLAVYVYSQGLTPAQIAYITQHPYYPWEYLEIWKYYVAAAGGLSIPVAMHHYQFNLGK